MKKILVIVIVMMTICSFAFAKDTVKVIDLTLEIDDTTVAVDEIDVEYVESVLNMITLSGVKIKSITPVQISIPMADGKFAPLTKYVIVVFEEE